MREQQTRTQISHEWYNGAGVSLADGEITRYIIIIPSAGFVRRDLASIR